MKFRAIQGEILSQESEAIVLYIGEDDILSHEFIYEANNNLENCLSDMASQGQLTGKKGELTLIHTLGHINPKRLLIVGLGKESDLSLDVIRNASAQFENLRDAFDTFLRLLVHSLKSFLLRTNRFSYFFIKP